LSDNVKNVEEDYLNELLNESKNSLMAIIEYDSEKNKDEISTLIIGKIVYIFGFLIFI
jgi:hypothetical protein